VCVCVCVCVHAYVRVMYLYINVCMYLLCRYVHVYMDRYIFSEGPFMVHFFG